MAEDYWKRGHPSITRGRARGAGEGMRKNPLPICCPFRAQSGAFRRISDFLPGFSNKKAVKPLFIEELRLKMREAEEGMQDSDHAGKSTSPRSANWHSVRSLTDEMHSAR